MKTWTYDKLHARVASGKATWHEAILLDLATASKEHKAHHTRQKARRTASYRRFEPSALEEKIAARKASIWLKEHREPAKPTRALQTTAQLYAKRNAPVMRGLAAAQGSLYDPAESAEPVTTLEPVEQLYQRRNAALTERS